MNKVVLKVKNLTKRFNNRVAVNNLTLDVFEGEIFGFLGPNGAGKTTAIRMITGLAKMDSGDVYICGKSIKTDFEKAIINVGGIIENPEMYKNFSGLDNLKYYASLYNDIPKERIMHIVELVDLKDRIKDKVKTYSLGMKQRLGIAQALLHYPKLLILDEPTNGLDPVISRQIYKLLKELNKKKDLTIIMVSHDIDRAVKYADRIIEIRNGKKVFDDLSSKFILEGGEKKNG